MKLINCLLLLLLALCSCKESDKERINRLMIEWSGREIAFPANILCLGGEDTLMYKIPNSEFLVLTYADSLDCSTFKKQLSNWKRLITKADSMTRGRVSFVFFLQPSDIDEIRYMLHKEKFHHPVCFDVEGKLHALNKFPGESGFRSFLLDMNRQVLAIGNPAHNQDTEAEYEKIIMSNHVYKEPEKITTEVSYVDDIDMGEFNWESTFRYTISMENTGTNPLVVADVITSSTCMLVEYSHEPVAPGKKWELSVSYKAERPECFSRDITIYCNAEDSPLNLKVRGNAR